MTKVLYSSRALTLFAGMARSRLKTASMSHFEGPSSAILTCRIWITHHSGYKLLASVLVSVLRHCVCVIDGIAMERTTVYKTNKT